MRKIFFILTSLVLIVSCFFVAYTEDTNVSGASYTGGGTAGNPYDYWEGTGDDTTLPVPGGLNGAYVKHGGYVYVGPWIENGYLYQVDAIESGGGGLNLAYGSADETETGEAGNELWGYINSYGTTRLRCSQGNGEGSGNFWVEFTVQATTYTVTWNNWDGTTLETDYNVSQGTTPSYNGATPTRPGNAQYSYTFAGWSPTVGPITGDTTYTAQFTQSTNTYTVTWNNWDGTTLETDTGVAYGSTPTYNSATPSRPATAQYTYTFTGWSPSVSTVTGNQTYTAQYSYVTNTYTITWKNWDGTTLETDTSVAYGSTPTYNSATPIRGSSGGYSYTFAYWSPSVSTVTGNQTYTANFTRSPIISVSGTGSLNVPYTYLGIYANDSSTYFNGTKYVNTGTQIYIYNRMVTDIEYYIDNYTSGHGLSVSGGVLSGVVTGNNGDTVTFNVYSSDGYTTGLEGTYSFVILDPSTTYTVTWNNWDGTTLETDTGVAYLRTPTYDGPTPTRASTGGYAYVFNGWSPAITTVTGNQTYTAQFTRSPIINVLGSGSLNSPYTYLGIYANDSSTYFNGTKYVNTGTEIYIYPRTVSGIEYYIDNYTSGHGLSVSDGLLSGTVSGNNGDTVTFNVYASDGGNTGLEGTYSFVILDPSTTYTVTWKNWDNTTLETDTGVAYLRTPTYDGATPTRADSGGYSYAFNGWSPNVGAITGDTTYTAQFTRSPIIRVMGTGELENPFIYVGIYANDSSTYFNGTKYVNTGTQIYIYPRAVSGIEYYIDNFTPVHGLSINDTVLSGVVTGNNGDTVTFSVYASDGGNTGLEGTYSFVILDPSTTYTVTWNNWDGTTLETDTGVVYLRTPTYDGATPTRASTEEYAYIFAGWSPTVGPITGNTTYTAQFTQTTALNVTWNNWDGTTLETDTGVAYGTTPTYDGATPTRASTVQNVYTFIGWEPVVSTITQDQTYTAQYSVTPIVYTSGDWSYNILDDFTIKIIGYYGTGGNVVIPSKFDNYGVSTIAYSVFSNNSAITGLVIPPRVVNIENDSFIGTSVTNVLNLSGLEITGTSYGLNNAEIITSIPGEYYISNVDYTLYDINANSPISIMIRLIPLILLIGLIIWLVYRIKDREDY